MTITITRAIELRCKLECDILKLIGDFEQATKMQVRCVNLNHVNLTTIDDMSIKRFVADLTIEVSL